MKLKIILWFLLCHFALFSQHTIKMAVGTYTRNTESKGIYMLEVDLAKKSFEIKDIQNDIQNPGFLSISKDKNFLFSVSEDEAGSMIKSYKLEVEAMSLHFIDSAMVVGKNPCFVCSTDSMVISANYSSGNINVFKRDSKGKLFGPVQNLQNSGSGPNKDRQEKPHVHQTILSSDSKFLLSNDLGNDKTYSYRVNDQGLVLVDSLKSAPGSGPRHLAFNRKGDKFYLLHELDGSISSVAFKDGKMLQESVVYLSSDKGAARAADIHLSTNGDYLYATNRGEYNSISLFQVRPKGLKFLDEYSTFGKTPRNFMITKDGNYLFVGNQDTHTIVIFAIHPKSGRLKKLDFEIRLPSPVCLLEL